MSLPKLDQPVYDLNLPSNSKKIKYRPFLVKEEKILLTAQESNDTNQILNAIVQIAKNCVVSPKKFDPMDLPLYDLEYLFLKLRQQSVNNIVELKYRDLEDDKVREFTIDLDEVVIEPNPKDINNKVQLTDHIGISLKHPTLKMITDDDFAKLDANKVDDALKMIMKCVEYVYDDDEVYDNFTQKELDEFLGNLQQSNFENISNFFDQTPKLKYTISYENEKGNERNIELEGLADFFM